MSGDMPKVWWSPCWGAVVGRAKHFEALESRRYFDELPEDAVELKPVSDAPAAPEALARLFHETYERLAPSFGYRTREASAVPWGEVPEANRRLMVAVAGEVLKVVAPAAPGETEWAAIHEDGTVIDCVDQDEARYYRDNPRHSHRDGYRAVRRAVIRSEWQEVTDDV